MVSAHTHSHVAVTRFVAYAADDGTAKQYVSAGLLIVGMGVVVLGSLLGIFGHLFALLFFASENYYPLILWMPLLLVGTGLHVVTYAYLRGSMRVQRANALVVFNQALAPPVAVYAGGGSVSGVLAAMGLMWVGFSLAFLFAVQPPLKQLRVRSIELASFGTLRLPGDLIQLTLFGLPVILVAHFSSIRTAGLIAFAVATVATAGYALTPVSFLLLPVALRPQIL
jgi:hypothetical protein